MKKPVIRIGLDAADPSLLEAWMSQGTPEESVVYAPRELILALTTLTTIGRRMDDLFLTGCLPEKTGYWAPKAA